MKDDAEPLILDSVKYEGTGRPLKSRFSTESAEDLKAVHSVDLSDELTKTMAEEIAKSADGLASDLVGVAPMSPPTGTIFALKHSYSADSIEEQEVEIKVQEKKPNPETEERNKREDEGMKNYLKEL